MDEEMARFEKIIQAREEVEKKIKEGMREKGLRELVIRGDQFEVVAQMADKPREYLDIKALSQRDPFIRWRKRRGERGRGTKIGIRPPEPTISPTPFRFGGSLGSIHRRFKYSRIASATSS
jgi:crotonobetainyl-CoA:carnitine CoA-transferase CaiB-like acyl-CoA transferase